MGKVMGRGRGLYGDKQVNKQLCVKRKDEHIRAGVSGWERE